MGDAEGTTLVVIPAFNEMQSIGAVITDVIESGLPCVVIDDASTDRTADVVRSSGAELVSLPINLGVGGAMKTGFQFAVKRGYDQIIQIDADGQHLAEEIPTLLSAARESGADMVVGSRFAAERSTYRMSWVRRRCVRALARRVRAAGITVTDPTSGFRLIREPLLSQFARDFPVHYLGDTYEALLVAGRRNYRVIEVAVEMRERQAGRPSADIFALIRSMVRSIAVAFTGPSFDVEAR